VVSGFVVIIRYIVFC